MGLTSFTKKIANTVGGIFNDLTGVTDATAQNKALMEYQNEYNLPINQISRLEQAGLNPNLIYGNGGASVMSASPSGVGKSNGMLDNIFSLPLQILSTKADLEKNRKEQDLLTEQQALTHQNSNRTIASTEYIKEQAIKLRNDNEFFKEHGYYPTTQDKPYLSGLDNSLIDDILGALFRGASNYEQRNRN